MAIQLIKLVVGMQRGGINQYTGCLNCLALASEQGNLQVSSLRVVFVVAVVVGTQPDPSAWPTTAEMTKVNTPATCVPRSPSRTDKFPPSCTTSGEISSSLTRRSISDEPTTVSWARASSRWPTATLPVAGSERAHPRHLAGMVVIKGIRRPLCGSRNLATTCNLSLARRGRRRSGGSLWSSRIRASSMVWH